MTLYLRGDEILLVGSIACGFDVHVVEPAQFKANVNRPATSAFGHDAYPTLRDKAAALLHSFVTTQTLPDGNKCGQARVAKTTEKTSGEDAGKQSH